MAASMASAVRDEADMVGAGGYYICAFFLRMRSSSPANPSLAMILLNWAR
jgi:hypothetical protein